MTPEHHLMNEIKLYCGQRNWICIRYNTGTIQDARTGKYIDFGPPVGHSDLIVYTDTGEIMFVETKIHPRKPTQQQLDFIKIMQNHGFLASVIYNLQEFIEMSLKLRRPRI